MKKFLAAAGLAGALMLGAAAPSMAAPVFKGDLGTYPAAGDSISTGFTATGTFDYYYTFTTTEVTTFTASVTNAVTKLSQFITNLTVALYTGAPPSGVALASDTDTSAPHKGAQFVAASAGGPADQYSIEITGTVTKSSPGLSFSISPVPLPSSVALFGVAVAGLGVAGAMRKRKSAATA